MTQREKLIELLKSPHKAEQLRKIGANIGKYEDDCVESMVADFLLANGVIVPPYKVGQKVYVLRSKTSNGMNLYLREERISHYAFDGTTYMCFESVRRSVSDDRWETSVFATPEEAEKALAERGEKNG